MSSRRLTSSEVVTVSALASILLVGGIVPRALAQGPDAAALGYVPGRVILKLTPEAGKQARASRTAPAGRARTGDAGLDALGQRYGVKSIEPLRRQPGARARSSSAARFEDVVILDLPENADVEAAVREYGRMPGVVYAQLDRHYELSFVPNDPYATSQGAWGQPYGDLWGLENINAASAWDVTRGAGTVIAVIDTGVDYTHPDLLGNVWENLDEIPDNSIDDDNNGYVDDVRGWDFVHDDNNPMDDDGHGTHVSGTAAAVGNNGIGIAGVAWQAVVMPLKSLGLAGGVTSWLVPAIEYAADNGADVINASWGGPGLDPLISEAIAYAHDAGTVFVTSAGNNSSDVTIVNAQPANDPNAIAVAAVNHLDELSYFSNFGPKIDVAAPGGGDLDGPAFWFSILSLRASQGIFTGHLFVGDEYLRLQGTSMASPHVAGLAALIRSINPGFDPEQIRQALRLSADDLGPPGVDDQFGAGRINAGRAVQLGNVLAVYISSPRSGGNLDGVVSIQGYAEGPDFAFYVLDYGVGTNPASWLPITGSVTTPVSAGTLGTWDVTTIADGTYTIRLRAADTGGQTFEYRVFVVIDHAIISAPASGEFTGVGGAPVEIRGTAAGFDFESYVVEVRLTAPDLTVGPWQSTGVTLVDEGTSPTVEGLLATLDPTLLGGSHYVDIRVSVTAAAGIFTGEVEGVIVDGTLDAGWPRQLPFVPGFNLSPMRNHLTLADLDGDGITEILLAYDDLVHVLEPDGSDRPGWPQSVATGAEPWDKYVDSAPAAADLDGDGLLEVVVANNDRFAPQFAPGTESVFVWHEDGTTMAGWPIVPETFGSYRHLNDVVLADVDSDEQPEILFTQRNRLNVMRADGTPLPGFPAVAQCVPQCGFFDGAPAVGDIDGDGQVEIAVVASSNREPSDTRQYLYVYDASGSTIHPFPRKILSKGVPDVSPVMADLDGDGQLDIAFASDRPKKAGARTGRGKRVRLHPRLPQFKLHPFASKQDPPTVGDVDGDGVAELLVGSGFPDAPTKGSISIVVPVWGTDYFSLLSRSRTTGYSIEFPFTRGDKIDLQGRLVGGGPGPAAVGDLDGDGDQDIVFGSGTCDQWGWPDDRFYRRCYTVRALDGRSGASLPGFPKATRRAAPTNSVQPAIGDLDGDGSMEVVWVDATATVYVWSVPGSPGPKELQWPMYRHDPGHTGVLAVTR